MRRAADAAMTDAHVNVVEGEALTSVEDHLAGIRPRSARWRPPSSPSTTRTA